MNARSIVAPLAVLLLLLVGTSVPAAAAVVGHVDSPVSDGPPFSGPVPIRGWALVTGSSLQLQIRVVENGNQVGGGFANLFSAYTAQVWGNAYANRGFDFSVNLPPGDHNLTVFAFDTHLGNVPIDPCTFGPIHVRVGNGSEALRGAITAPLFGQPTTSIFDLEGYLVDDANPTRTVSGVLRYRSNGDAEQTIPITANLQRSDVGPHGFRVRMTLTTSRHWYFNLFATQSSGCLVPAGMLNLDLVCPQASVVASPVVCPGSGVAIGMTPPTLYGEPWIYRWSPVTGLSDSTSPNPVASPTTTTTYTLLVSDPAGACSDSKSTTVTVLSFSALATSSVAGCAPSGGTSDVTLGGSSTGGSGSITWAWDYDSDGTWDATGLASPAMVHPYAPGSWTATLRAVATGTPSCTTTATTTFTVSTLAATASSTVASCAPTGATAVVALGGSATGATGVTWAWDYEGDGTWDSTGLTTPATEHSYAAGTYAATLRATAGGCSATATTTFTVSTCVPPPVTGCAPRSVGYWSQQFDGNHAQKERACDSIATIEAASPVFFESLETTSDRCAQFETILNTGSGTMFERAVRQLLGLRLNVATGKISEARGISLSWSSSTTVGAALVEIETVLTNGSSPESEQERVKDLAESLDHGCGYDPACESGCESSFVISQDGSSRAVLDWNATWTRSFRVERSLDPGVPGTFVDIVGTEYVDPDSGSGDVIFYQVNPR
jgi:PKD repeat protein